jgi:hypothetical protein
MPVLTGKPAPIVLCHAPELVGEIRQRLPCWAETHAAPAALWVEPLAGTWQDDLEFFAGALPGGAPLVVIASRPLAHLLPERCSWEGRSLGVWPGGIGQLHRALGQAGFAIEASYGIHSALAIGLSILSGLMERWRRPDISDRLHFAARLRYHTTGPLAALSMVALLIARKEPD